MTNPFAAASDMITNLATSSDLTRRQAQVDRLLAADGAGHLVHDLPMRIDGRTAALTSRPWRLDPTPLTLDTSTYQWLAAAVAERMAALELVLADLYGQRRLLQQRIIPPETVAGSNRYRLSAVGTEPPRWLTTYAVDVMFDTEGLWRVVQDYTDSPSGLGYALLNRSVLSRVVPRALGHTNVASLAPFVGAMRHALAATARVKSPRTVLFSGGLDHPTFVDHSYLAVQLGINLVEGADLVVRQGRVWLRTLDGLEPIDVLYRRVTDTGIDPLDVGATGSIGVPGLLQAIRDRGVASANANGAGVIEMLGRQVDTAIDAIAPRRLALATAGSAPAVTVPVAPGVVRDANGVAVAEAGVVLRLFAVASNDGVTVLRGATGRLLAPGDDPARPTAAAAKDVWVLGTTGPTFVTAPLPQVDFGRSVPTRAADALYWTNRAAERAEAIARTMRVISARLELDPAVADAPNGGWIRRMQQLAIQAGRSPIPDYELSVTIETLEHQLDILSVALVRELGSLLTEATTIREFSSGTTGRVLTHLAEVRAGFQQGTFEVDDLDNVVLDLAALSGLWRESTVRGPAWRIGDTGRRLERLLVTLDLVEATFLPVDSETPDRATIEVLLAATESLVAYRRRHRSDVEPEAALALLVHDESNPRSLAGCIADLSAHYRDGEIAIGSEFGESAQLALSLPVDEMVPMLRRAALAVGQRVVGRWFSTPVAPVVMGSI